MTEPVDILLKNTIGTNGLYQICIILLIMLSRPTITWHPMLVVVVAPPVGNFSCSDPTKDKCADDCPGHVFDHSVWEWTIVHEWDLVCDKAYIVSLVQSIVVSGQLVGNVAIGTIADRYGRRYPLIFGVIIMVISSVAAAFAPWLWLYVTLRWISTVAIGTTMMPTITLLVEFTQSKYRPYFAIITAVPAQIAYGLLGLIGYYCRRWNHIQLIVSVPFVILFLYWCILPESPRWLLAMGKTERLVQTLERGARCNKLPTENIRPQVEEFVSKNPITLERRGNWGLLFRTKRMRMKTLVCIINWTIIGMDWYAISQYMGQIAGNVFLNITAAGLVKIPGSLIAMVMVNKMNRKTSLLLALNICAVPMLVLTLVMLFTNYPDWSMQLMGCVSMMGCSMSWALILVYTSELLPTVVRVLGLGLASSSARCSAMVAPFLMDTKKWGNWIPPLIFGAFPAIAVICTFVFPPETKGKPLPATVEEADKI